MRLQSILLSLAIAFLAISSCKKDSDDFPQTLRHDAEAELALQNLKTEEERNFFDWDYLTSVNPHLLEHIKTRSTPDSLITSVFQELLLLNQEHNFVPNLIQYFGYPIWNQSEILEDTTNSLYQTVSTPFAKTDENKISGYTIAFPHGWLSSDSGLPTAWSFTIVDRNQIDSLVQLDDSIDIPGLAFHVAGFLNFDYQLFGTVDLNYKNWLKQQLVQDSIVSGISVKSRNNSVTIGRCIAVGIAFSSEEVLERTPCDPGAGWAYVTTTYTIPCDPGISGVPGDDSGIGGPINTGGWGGGGGGGSNNGSYEISQTYPDCGGSVDDIVHPVVDWADLLELCQCYEAANEGGGIPTNDEACFPQGYNTEEESNCEMLLTIYYNVPLESAALICAWNKNHSLLEPLSEYIQNHEGTLSPQEASAMALYIPMLVGEQTNLDWDDFLNLYKLVVNVLQPQLGLNQNEVNFLLGPSASGFASQINNFLASHPNNDLAKVYANVVIDETSNEEVWGDINITSQNFFEGYDELVSYLNAETEQATEIQNGIEILETYLPATPQQVPAGAIKFGGSIPNPLGGPDLESDTDRDYSIFNLVNYPAVLASVERQESMMKILLYSSTEPSGMRPIASSYMSKFKNNPAVFFYYNPTLSSRVKDCVKMRNWLKSYGKELNTILKDENGDINHVIPPEEITRVALNENNGFTILINDTQKVDVFLLDSWEYNENTGVWAGYFLVNVIDHFGLDNDDAVDVQYLPGFVSWWALQYRRGWHPFKTDIWFVAHLSGNINN